MENLSENLFKKFDSLTGRLSPENLNCDGEISRHEARRRYQQIIKEWKELEVQAGRKVTEEEIDDESWKKIKDRMV